MSEQFYERQLVSLIRQNEMLKNDLKRFKAEALQGFQLLIKAVLAEFNADNQRQIQSYVELRKQLIFTNDNMAKLSQMVVGSISEKLKQRQAKESERTSFYQCQMSEMLKTHLSGFQISQNSKNEEKSPSSKEKSENLLVQQLRHEIDVLNQKEEAYKKKVESLKSIIRELENQVIQSKYICECQRRNLQEEIKQSREQKEKAEFELKRALYSYDQLALHQDNRAPREGSLYKNERNKAKTNS